MQTLAKRSLGSTGIEVSCLGLGTVKFGRNQEVKYPQGFRLPSDAEVESLLAQAAELGINLLDTAPAYGSSEQRLGRLLRHRERWLLASKVGEEFLAGKSVYNFDRQSVRTSLERSLRNLKTDYLDLVLIHSDGNDLAILDASDCVETLQKAKDSGLVRAIGMSTKTVAGGLRALELMDVAMVTYHAGATDDGTVIDYAAAHNKGILIKKAFNSGHMASGKSAGEESGGESGEASREDSREAVQTDPAQQALEFALSRPGVSSVIVGTINPRHLQSNVEVALALG